MTARALLGLLLVHLAAVTGWGADLTGVHRVLRKEPAYKTKSPKYCLLVFGPEARTHVWLVLDGDTLYADRNGNGDLTEAGEKVAANKKDGNADGEYIFEAGDIPDGNRLHKSLRLSAQHINYLAERDEQAKAYLARDPRAVGYAIGVDVEMPGHKGIGVGGRVEQCVVIRDANGFLRLGETPQRAPVVHFGGPWQVALVNPQRLTAGVEGELFFGLGTPGLGAGTTAWVGYEGIVPEGVYPTAEISYPVGSRGGAPARQRYELRQRC
jgi:hypothetical protein